jgi:hypothetical protein
MHDEQPLTIEQVRKRYIMAGEDYVRLERAGMPQADLDVARRKWDRAAEDWQYICRGHPVYVTGKHRRQRA